MEDRYKSFKSIEHVKCETIEEIESAMKSFSPHKYAINTADCKVNSDFEFEYKNGSNGKIPLSKEGFVNILKLLKIPTDYIKKVTSENLALKNINDRLVTTSQYCYFTKSNIGNYLTDIFPQEIKNEIKIKKYLEFLKNSNKISPESLKKTDVSENYIDMSLLFDIPGITTEPMPRHITMYGYKTMWNWLSNKKPKIFLASYATQCTNSMIYRQKLDLNIKTFKDFEESMILNLEHAKGLGYKQSLSVKKFPSTFDITGIYSCVKNILEKDENTTSLILKISPDEYDSLKETNKKISKDFYKSGKIILGETPKYPDFKRNYYDVLYDMTFGSHEYVSSKITSNKLEEYAGKILSSLN